MSPMTYSKYLRDTSLLLVTTFLSLRNKWSRNITITQVLGLILFSLFLHFYEIRNFLSSSYGVLENFSMSWQMVNEKQSVSRGCLYLERYFLIHDFTCQV